MFSTSACLGVKPDGLVSDAVPLIVLDDVFSATDPFVDVWIVRLRALMLPLLLSSGELHSRLHSRVLRTDAREFSHLAFKFMQ